MPSTAYKALKAQALTFKIKHPDEQFKAKLTRPIAKELLARAKDCRPIHPDKASAIAWAFCTDTFDIETDAIAIFKDNDNLCNGVQRLAGFLESGLKEVWLYMAWIEEPTWARMPWARMHDTRLTPADALDLLSMAEPTSNRYIDDKRVKRLAKQMQKGAWKAHELHAVTVKALFAVIYTANNGLGNRYKNIPDGIYKWLASFAKGTRTTDRLTAERIKEIGSLTLNELLVICFKD